MALISTTTFSKVALLARLRVERKLVTGIRSSDTLTMVHEAAKDGFGRNAGIYQKARPSYPSELLARFVDHYGSDRILEIGAGSGIFTQQLVDAGLDVVAVEPVASMRDHLMQQAPSIEVLDGTAERLPVGDASFDVVAVAHSFDWFDFERSLDEICRVLRPSGHLVTVEREVRNERLVHGVYGHR